MRLGRRMRLERPAHPVPGAELSVLGLLYRRGPMSAGDVAAAERVQPQSLTRTLAALRDKKLIRRQHDPCDRRRSLLSLPEAGANLLLADIAQRDRWLARAIAEQLSPAETQLLMMAGELMERLAEAGVTAVREIVRSALPCRAQAVPFPSRPASTRVWPPCASPPS